MCTAISYKVKDHYFGRNLDLYYRYNEKITITPRKFPLEFRMTNGLEKHYAFIGMATVEENYPLYYEATNEKGLSIAALNFPQNAVYYPVKNDMLNITPFEFIPWVMCNFDSVEQIFSEIKKINLVNINFSTKMPLSPIHWMISDKFRSMVVEPMGDGLKVYENPIGVLTNNPPFNTQMLLLQNYLGLSAEFPQKSFSPVIKANPYSLGMGAMGLPGDPSSPSRFARATFIKLSSVCDGDEVSAVGQFFHILGSAEQQKGVTKTLDGKYEYTLYSSCANTDKGIYYYTTYKNRSITAINMKKENLNSNRLITFNLQSDEKITFQN